jgi:hypothetical protein
MKFVFFIKYRTPDRCTDSKSQLWFSCDSGKDVETKLPGAIEKINTKDSYQQKPHVEINNFTSHLIKHSKKEKNKTDNDVAVHTQCQVTSFTDIWNFKRSRTISLNNDVNLALTFH